MYGVNIFANRAAEEVLSDHALEKFRHLDTITAKGRSVKQKIIPHDSQHRDFDVFLFECSAGDANLDAERYASNIFGILTLSHVTELVLFALNMGRDQYLARK